MLLVEFFTASIVSVAAGLDRTAAFQIMICRPIVAAPLTGWFVGTPLIGLEVGLLVELLWLCFLPVGAVIPPDDTQVSIAATFLAGVGGAYVAISPSALVVPAVFFCCPMGMVGQIFEIRARQFNTRFSVAAQAAISAGRIDLIDRYHLKGLLTFGLSSWLSFTMIVLSGAAFLYLFFAVFELGHTLDPAAGFLRILFPLAGVASILANLKIRRSMTIFFVSFLATLMLLWLF